MDAVYGFLVKELFSILGRDLRDRLDIVPELEKLRKKLLQVQALLMDAERRYTEPGVNILRDDLRDLLYDMDDIIDEVKIQGLEEQVAGNQDQVRSLFSVASNKLKKVKELWSDGEFNKAIRQKINKVLANFEEVEKYVDRWRGNSSGLTGGVSPGESEVYGREKDKESLIELIFATARDQNKKNYSVISIVGMGGVGKTTLAQLVFNDERVKPEYNMLSWACVSDVFDVAKVTKDLIEYSTNENNCSGMALPVLQERLKKKVSGKRFLLVLDDIWTSKEWDCVKAPLKYCAKGSIILVTTRNKAIANAISNTPPYELGILGDEQCWSLFKDKAFRDVDGNAEEHLFKLGKEIVKKCKGIPLAVKVLGAMLQGAELERWRAVLKNELWCLKNDEMFPALWVSYDYLPSPLKCCFEYFSLFPTDYKFDEEKLVLMWVGEGFIEAEENRQLEDIGRQYFNDLKRRCLIQNNNQIHDLMHSLACVVSGDFYCRLSSDRRSCKSLKRARHASLLGEDEETDIRVLDEAKGLRTILQFGYFSHGLMDKLSEWRFLRVVKLKDIETLPSFISDLEHMRYLDISYNVDIMDLPDAVCELHNLQYLSVANCEALENIPKDVGNLLNLWYLNLSSTSISSLPQSICKLCNLQVLDLNHCKGLTHLPEDIGDLQSLRHLHLSSTRISSLPQSICKLYTLQVLKLRECSELTDLPEDIGDLGNLMSLDLRYTKMFSLPDSIVKATNLQNIYTSDYLKLPPYFGKLTSLQCLEACHIGKEIGRGIGELKDMNNLEGNLSISNLENVDKVEEAKLANMKSKKNISGLEFKWSAISSKADYNIMYDGWSDEDYDSEDDNDDNASLVVRDGELEVKVLEALEPPSVLTYLSFENYSGERFPKWMSRMNFSTLNRIVMRGLGRVSKLVDVELPSLETLEIYECSRLRDISMFIPKLSDLRVDGCRELTTLSWFPSLRDSNSHFSLQTNVTKGQLTQIKTRVSISSCRNLRDIFMGPHVSELLLICLPSLTPSSLRFSKASITQTEGWGLKMPTQVLLGSEVAGCSNSGLIPQFPASPIEECEKLTSLDCLTKFLIINCGELGSLWQLRFPVLEELRIEGCKQLRSLAMDGPSLTTIEIRNCEKLESVGIHCPALKLLRIWNCVQLKSLDGPLPPSLTTISISDSVKLESSFLSQYPSVKSYNKLRVLVPIMTLMILQLIISGWFEMEFPHWNTRD